MEEALALLAIAVLAKGRGGSSVPATPPQDAPPATPPKDPAAQTWRDVQNAAGVVGTGIVSGGLAILDKFGVLGPAAAPAAQAGGQGAAGAAAGQLAGPPPVAPPPAGAPPALPPPPIDFGSLMVGGWLAICALMIIVGNIIAGVQRAQKRARAQVAEALSPDWNNLNRLECALAREFCDALGAERVDRVVLDRRLDGSWVSVDDGARYSYQGEREEVFPSAILGTWGPIPPPEGVTAAWRQAALKVRALAMESLLTSYAYWQNLTQHWPDFAAPAGSNWIWATDAEIVDQLSTWNLCDGSLVTRAEVDAARAALTQDERDAARTWAVMRAVACARFDGTVLIDRIEWTHRYLLALFGRPAIWDRNTEWLELVPGSEIWAYGDQLRLPVAPGSTPGNDAWRRWKFGPVPRGGAWFAISPAAFRNVSSTTDTAGRFVP